MASRKPVASPGCIQRSYDRAASSPAATPDLRKEKSSPAVLQHTNSGLVRNVITASGQGAAALFAERRSNAAVWRTRSIRNKHESYCILQLKQPTKGLTVQVTFLSPATTPREIRLLHAVVSSGPFKPLAAQHSSEAVSSDRVQHSLTVNPSVQVQRFLKVEMNGQAVPTASGTSHAVCQLNVVHMSAMTASSAAKAKQLPVPAPESPEPAAELSAVVPESSFSSQAKSGEPISCGMQEYAETCVAANIPQQPSISAAQSVLTAATGRNDMFTNWLSQTRSSIQCSRTSSNLMPGTTAEAMPFIEQQQREPQQQKLQLDYPTLTEAAGEAALLPQSQQKRQAVCEAPSSRQLQTTLESNRQQLLQLQQQYHLHAKAKQQQKQPPELVSSFLRPRPPLAGPRLHSAGQAAAAVLSAAGRPSTVLSLLQRSESWSQEDNDTSNLDDSMDSVVIGDNSCITEREPTADNPGAEVATQDSCDVAQQQPQPGVLQDESAVLQGSITQGQGISEYSCQGPHAVTGELDHALSVDRCSSSCSVRGPINDQEHVGDATSAHQHVGVDEASSVSGDSDGGVVPNDMCHLPLPLQQQDSASAVVWEPQLTDSNSCVPVFDDSRPSRNSMRQDDAVSPLSDRKVQSCPAMHPLLDSYDVNYTPIDGPRLAVATQTGSTARKASSVDHQQCMLASCQQQAGLGVTLSPEVIRCGQLVKQSCPTLSFPRYRSHSPARHSRDWQRSVADADAARRDEHAGDAALKRSRLGSAFHRKAWQQPQQADRGLTQDAAEIRQVVDQVVVATDAACEDEAAVHTMSETSVAITETPAPDDGCSASSKELVGCNQTQEIGITTAAATSCLEAAESQQDPIQNKLLQALLFSSCDFSNSADISQMLEQQQTQPAARGESGVGTAAGFDSPQKVQELGFLSQASSVLDASHEAAALDCNLHVAGGCGVVNLSPIAESPEVARLSGSPASAGLAGESCSVVPDDMHAQQQQQQGPYASCGSQDVPAPAESAPEEQHCTHQAHQSQPLSQQSALAVDQLEVYAADAHPPSQSDAGGEASTLQQLACIQQSQQPAQAKSTASAKDIAEGSEAGYLKVHSGTFGRVSGNNQVHNGAAGETSAGASARSSSTSAGRLGASAKQRPEQQHVAPRVTSHRSSSSIASSCDRKAGAVSLHTSKQSGSSKQQPSAPVRSSYVKLNPRTSQAQAVHSSSSSSSANVKESKPMRSDHSGVKASARSQESSKYEQLLRSQFGKAPAVRGKPQIKGGSSTAGFARRQQDLCTGPLTSSLNLRELLGGTTGTAAGTVSKQPLPAVDPAVVSTGFLDDAVALSRISVQEQPSQLGSKQHWRGFQRHQDQLPFVQAAADLHPGVHANPGQQQQRSPGRVSESGQPTRRTPRSSPASPEAQLNIFLPKLVRPELLTPKTIEHPSRNLGNALCHRDSTAALDLERGPTPSTPPWLGMASPKSSSKQQQQRKQQTEQQPQQNPQLEDNLQGGHVQAPWLAADVDLENSVDAAIEAASNSLGLPCSNSTANATGSGVSQGLSAQQGDTKAHFSAAAESSSADAAPVEDQMQAVGDPIGSASSSGKAQSVLVDNPTNSAAPNNNCIINGSELTAGKCSNVASHIPGGNTAIAASFKLQTSGQAVVTPPAAVVLLKDSTDPAAASDPCQRSTVVVSIVKHCKGGQQEQVQLQQQYVFETQAIEDVVLLHNMVEGDSCVSCTSSAAAPDVSTSVEARLQTGQYKVPCGSPTATEESVAAVGRHTLPDAEATATADWEEVASSNEPGPAAADQSAALNADSYPDSPGSCSSAVVSSRHKPSGLPQHLLRPGQVKSRLRPQQVAAANALVVDHEVASHTSGIRPHNNNKAALQTRTVTRVPGEQSTAGEDTACSDNKGVVNNSLSSSQQSFLTASSQRGTVWPHAGPRDHVDTSSGDEASARASVCSGSSSVSDTGLRSRQADCVQRVHDAEQAADTVVPDVAVGVPLARNYYRSVPQQQAEQISSAAGSQTNSGHNSQGSIAISGTSSATHSLWDETDPVADTSAPAATMSDGADEAATAALPEIGCPVRTSQQPDMPHRVKHSPAGVLSAAAVQHPQACVAAADGLTHQHRIPRGTRQSMRQSLDDSSASGVSVVSEADSAASTAGPSRPHATAAASAGDAVAADSAAVTGPYQQASACVQGASTEHAGSTSLSFAAMHHTQSGYSSVPSGPGISATATSNPLSGPAAGDQATALLAACGSQEGSIGSNDAEPVQAGLSQRSLNDVGVTDGCKATDSKLDQSPTKQPARNQSPSKQLGDKALATTDAALSFDAVTGFDESGPGSAGSAARTMRASAADQGRQALADDAASISSRGSGHCKPVQVQHWLDQQRRHPSSPLPQQQQALSGASQHTGNKPRMQPRLQVDVPSSPQVSRMLASLVNFSPLHAGRSSRGSCGGSTGQANVTPAKQPSAQAPAAEDVTQNPAIAVQPAFCLTAANMGAAAPSAALGGSAKQLPAGSLDPCAVFSPLHSMKPGSGSVGRVSSKTHSRTKQGSSSQDEEVSMVRKNLMDDMLKAAVGDCHVAAGHAGAAGKQSEHQPDTHEVRDSRHGTAVVAWEAATEQQTVRLQTPNWPQKGSVLSNITLPTIGASPMQQQQQLQPHSLVRTKSSDMVQLMRQGGEQSSMQLQAQPSDALTAEQTMHSQWSTRASTDSIGTESIQFMSQSSAAAAAALRAAAATPAPIPCRTSADHSMSIAESQAGDQAQTSENQHSTIGLHGEVGASFAVLSLDGCIPPVVTGSAAQQSSVLDTVQAPCAVDAPAASSSTTGSTIKQQVHTSPKLPTGPLTAPGSEGRVNRNTTGPLSSGLLRRGNSLGSLSRMLAVGMPPVNLAAPASPEIDHTDQAAAGESSGPGGCHVEQAAERNTAAITAARFSPNKLQQIGIASSPAASRLVTSPYLQQLEEHCAQQQQQLAASPLSAFRHNLPRKDLQQQQQQQQGISHLASASAGDAAVSRPESSSSCLPATPLRTGLHTRQQADGVPAALTGIASGQDLGAATRGTSCGGRISPTAGGNSGAARMGKLRHRRARSDMPEYYPLSPLESPLHTAMPEDAPELCELTLSPQVSAAAVAAIAAAEAAAGAGKGLPMLQTSGEPINSPLGSPLRHGLTSPAAMYRIQQQQLKEQASQFQLDVGAEYSGAAAASDASLAISREVSNADLQQKQKGVAAAVADAVAAYEGSISPRRLARIQEYVSGLLSTDVGGSILDQHNQPSKSVPAVIAAGTPGKESDAFDSFNLNNQPNIQAELEEHSQQLEQQTKPQEDQQACSVDAVHIQQHPQLQLEEVPSCNDVSNQQQVVSEQQQQCQLPSRHELSDVLSTRLSQCSSSTVRASIEALLATKLRVNASIDSRSSSRSQLAAATAAAGEGQCAATVVQLLRGSQQVMTPWQEHAAADIGAKVDSSNATCNTNAYLTKRQQHAPQEPAMLTSAKLAQHSINSNSSQQSSNQRYPLNAELSHASSAAAIPAETTQLTAGSCSVLSSVEELPDEPALLSASTESMSLPAQQNPEVEHQGWLDAEYSGCQMRQSADSQQVAVMQSHGALLGPGPAELSTAAGGAAADDDGDDIHPPAVRPPRTTAAAAPARHALAGGMFRRSAQLLAGLAQGLMAPGQYDSIESTAGSMAVCSRAAAGSRATCEGLRGLRKSQQGLSDDDDDEFAEQLRASVNLVAGSLDISGPQVVRLTQQLWLNRLVPGTVPEEEPTEQTAAAATAGSSQRSTSTGSAGTRSFSNQGSAGMQQQQQHVSRRHLTQQHNTGKATAPGIVATTQQQMGPLLAGRLAAMAAMRQLRRSSVGESPDVVADSNNYPIQQSSRFCTSVTTAAAGEGERTATSDAAGTGMGLQASYAASTGSGIGRGRLTAAEAAAPGALTSSNSFGSGGIPDGLRLQQRQRLTRPASASVSASAASFNSNKHEPCEQQAGDSCRGWSASDDDEPVTWS